MSIGALLKPTPSRPNEGAGKSIMHIPIVIYLVQFNGQIESPAIRVLGPY